MPRFLDEFETLASVLLAIAFAHLLDAKNVGWAAFSGYMVMRSQWQETLIRGGLRIAGTVAGAITACLLAGIFDQSELSVSLSVALVGAVTLYCAITKAHSYAWLFTGLTFSMVALDALQQPAISVFAFASTRVLEVVAGTCACLLVRALSTVTIRSWLAATPLTKPKAKNTQASSRAIIHAALAGLALALTPFLGRWMELEYISQAAITIMAVMMVPLSALTPNSNTVHTKNIHRLLGCTAGAVMAGVMVLCFGNSWLAMTLGMSLGVLLGRHIENSGRSYAYVGTQFALVYLVLMVPDSYLDPSVESGLARLGGIVTGAILIEALRLLRSPWKGRRYVPE